MNGRCYWHSDLAIRSAPKNDGFPVMNRRCYHFSRLFLVVANRETIKVQHLASQLKRNCSPVNRLQDSLSLQFNQIPPNAGL
jgi:hypothetical protein